MINIDLEKLVVVDIETLSNLFTVYLKDVKTKEEKKYIIYGDKLYDGQALALFQLLKKLVKHGYTLVTYNGLAFDMQVLDYFYSWCSDKIDPLYEFNGEYIATELYKKANEIINIPDDLKHEKLVYESQLFMPTIDLFVQQHYNVPGKYTSLKWLEFTMKFPNIEEMPIEHNDHINIEDIDSIIAYNRNDVLATYEFFMRIKHETELRIQLTKEYDVHLINSSEPSMAKKIFGKILSKEMGIPFASLRKMKTIRDIVKFDEIIFPYTKFITPQLRGVLDDILKISVDCNPNIKQNFSYNFNYNGLPIYLGLGGIHGCTKPGVYTPKKDEVIRDSDVKSFYPNLAIVNSVKPKHLGEAFIIVYEDIYEQRKLIPKKDPKNYIYKILLNSTYGLSSEINSYFYDKQFTYTITINGQLSLLMLAEALTLGVPDIKILQMNTDGLTHVYKKEYHETVEKICTWWQKLTNLELEHGDYAKMVIQDVNNYIAVDTKGSVKKKGMFETELFLHKNHSNLIIPKAIEKYFINDVPIQEYITHHDNIFDFCAAAKKKNNFKLNLYSTLNGLQLVQEQQKVMRYVVSKEREEAGMLYKDFSDGRKVSVMANTLVRPLNTIDANYADPNLYDVDYNYYIRKCKEVIENITPSVTQIEMFK